MADLLTLLFAKEWLRQPPQWVTMQRPWLNVELAGPMTMIRFNAWRMLPMYTMSTNANFENFNLSSRTWARRTFRICWILNVLVLLLKATRLIWRVLLNFLIRYEFFSWDTAIKDANFYLLAHCREPYHWSPSRSLSWGNINLVVETASYCSGLQSMCGIFWLCSRCTSESAWNWRCIYGFVWSSEEKIRKGSGAGCKMGEGAPQKGESFTVIRHRYRGIQICGVELPCVVWTRRIYICCMFSSGELIESRKHTRIASRVSCFVWGRLYNWTRLNSK